MEGLTTTFGAIKNVQNSIEKFETLSLSEAQENVPTKKPIVEIVDSDEEPRTSIFTPTSEKFPLTEIPRSLNLPVPDHKRHKKHDSTVFLQQAYLQESQPQNSLPDDSKEILKSQPDEEDLLAVLQYLQYGIEGQHAFNVRAIGPQATQIVHVLVNVTVPDHWRNFSRHKLSIKEKEMRSILISCLKSTAGISALLTQIRKMAVFNASQTAESGTLEAISVLAQVLNPKKVILTLMRDTMDLRDKTAQRKALWQELCSLLGGSKVLATVSQAATKLQGKKLGDSNEDYLADGTKYSRWLANRISNAAIEIKSDNAESWVMISQLLKRGMNLGYRDHFVSQCYSCLLIGTKALWTPLHLMLQPLPPTDQINFFDAMLRNLAHTYLSSSSSDTEMKISEIEQQSSIGGVAAIVKGITSSNKVLDDYLVEWLSSTNGDQASLSLQLRRAVIATLALHEEKLQTILDRCMQIFSDKIAIQHLPILRQDALAQTILLVVGCLHRLDTKLIKEFGRSSLYLQSVSNRLAASAPRARVLGMVVGVAVSGIVDDPAKSMRFEVGEMESEDVKMLTELVRVADRVGDIQALQKSVPLPKNSRTSPIRSKPKLSHHSKPLTSKIISIEEVSADSDDEDDLTPYRKPDDDPLDSDEDATLINRAKPTVPVYIIDLLRYLQMNEKPDVVELALKTAPSIIRRKANHGTELSEHIHALAAALLNLQDGMTKKDSHQLRLESMIACLVAVPVAMGPWLASMYFEGDFSLSQRASLLTTIGLGTRELAGFNEDPKLSNDPKPFPSQRLPAHLDLLYAPMNSVAGQLSHATLQPMALAAADKLSGPDVLKVRSFSSRIEVEKKTAQKAKERKTKIPKDLHRLLAESFYLPLCCRMTMLLSSHTNPQRLTIFEPHMMKLFLQTLVVVFTNLGPNATQLPTLTSETLNLLLALHNVANLALNPVVLPPLLQLLLTTLQLNIEAGTTAQERLITDFGTSIAELVAWAGNIGNIVSVPVSDGSDGMPWTVLLAGCQVKWQEVGRKFQGRIMGLMGAGFDEF